MNIVILTGAGISAESGIQTFRAEDGLWENHPIEAVATPEGFARDPDRVYAFYNARRAQLQQALIQPNPAHHALATLARSAEHQVYLITQNVDDLHERAGSPQVHHMHGELKSAKCPISEQNQPWATQLTGEDLCQCCQPAQSLRPDIVWFGEIPYDLDQCERHLQQTDLFVAIGTSGQVYPAAGFAAQAKRAGAHLVEINLVATDHVFDERYEGVASEMVPLWVTQLLEK